MARKHWRKFITNNLLPPKYELVVKYTPLINSLVSIITNGALAPRDLHARFYSSFNMSLYGKKKPGDSLTIVKYLNEYSEDDLRQQCYLYLLEIWNWCLVHWKKNTTTVFYDYVRALLPQYMGRYIAQQVKLYIANIQLPVLATIDPVEREHRELVKLSWVVLRDTNTSLSKLSVKQRYLLYLRYSKQYTIKQIAASINQHRAKIEAEFSVIYQLIGDQYELARIKPKDTR